MTIKYLGWKKAIYGIISGIRTTEMTITVLYRIL